MQKVDICSLTVINPLIAHLYSTYAHPSQTVIAKDGVIGLFGRGLGTKLITNGIQGILFSVLWRLGQVRIARLPGLVLTSTCLT